MPPTSMVACDANISARAATTSCGFAENVFFAFYEDATASKSQNAIHAYSTASDTDYAVACATDAGHVTCMAGDGGEVRFDLAAVRAYDDDQATAYAANHDLGPNVGTDAGNGASGGSTTDVGNGASGSGGGTSDPSSAATSPAGDPPVEDRIPNYDNGTGYRVQCADGMWSQSGGRPGACSYHGGVG
jgi:hypothetical protein